MRDKNVPPIQCRDSKFFTSTPIKMGEFSILPTRSAVVILRVISGYVCGGEIKICALVTYSK